VATTISTPSESITSDFIPPVKRTAKYCRICYLTARLLEWVFVPAPEQVVGGRFFLASFELPEV
jgi:hypothetical protein